MSSTKLIKSNLAVNSVKSMITLMTTNNSYNYLYLFFGRSAAWPNEAAPPTYIDTPFDEKLTRDAAIGIKIVNEDEMCPVCPRHDWVSGTVYTQYRVDAPVLFGQNFYVLTSNNEVYKCIDNNDGAASTVEPTGENESSITTTADGYQWKYMFTLNSSQVRNFLTSQWIPVPYQGGQPYSGSSSVYSASVPSENSPPSGHGYGAMEELGATSLMISQTINGNEGGLLPSSTTFRQFGLWKSPLLLEGSESVATRTFAENTVYKLTEGTLIDKLTGHILYIENRTPVTIQYDQSVNIQIVLNF